MITTTRRGKALAAIELAVSVIVRGLKLNHDGSSPPAHVDRWRLDDQSMELMGPGHACVRLSMTEFQVARCLLNKAGLACSHAEIAAAMGLMPDEWDRHRVEVVVSRLRTKVERDTGRSFPIRSVRGVGYAMAQEERLTPRGSIRTRHSL